MDEDFDWYELDVSECTMAELCHVAAVALEALIRFNAPAIQKAKCLRESLVDEYSYEELRAWFEEE